MLHLVGFSLFKIFINLVNILCFIQPARLALKILAEESKLWRLLYLRVTSSLHCLHVLLNTVLSNIFTYVLSFRRQTEFYICELRWNCFPISVCTSSCFSLARWILTVGRSICTTVTADVIICTEAAWSQQYQLKKTIRPDNLGSTPAKNTWIFLSISRASLTQSVRKLQGFSLYYAVQTRRKRLPSLGLLTVTSTFAAS